MENNYNNDKDKQTNENNRNQIANETDENIKNPFWKYLVIGIGSLIAFGMLFWFVYSKVIGGNTEEAPEEAKKATYATQNGNFNAAAIKALSDREDVPTQQPQEENNKTEEEPKTLIKENNAAKKASAPILTKSGIVVGEAANTPENLGGNNLKFQKKSTFLNLGQEEDENGNVTPKMTGKDGDNGDIFSPTAAYFSTFDRNLLLAKGTYIGCSLKTKLVSDIKGGIACIISNDVYSANGRTLLIEKGSIVTGTYNGGSMEEGMERIYVIWQEIRTPNNIVIPVFSGASDRLGAAGIEGWVDNHYFKRFGSAILMSIIDDATSALGTHLSKNKENSYDYSAGTTETVNELATKTLEKMIDIKPTLYKNHGDIVGIYVNRDIDFRNVYDLKRKNRE